MQILVDLKMVVYLPTGFTKKKNKRKKKEVWKKKIIR